MVCFQSNNLRIQKNLFRFTENFIRSIIRKVDQLAHKQLLGRLSNALIFDLKDALRACLIKKDLVRDNVNYGTLLNVLGLI
jgi:hypothetical protein